MSRGSYTSCKPLPAVPTKHVDVLETELERPPREAKPWRPVTLRPLYLCALVIITVGLIAIIQWLFYVSRRDHGILFAKDINDLPLSRSFSYMYLPTIVSVLYSFLWTWVDLDIKRLEPFFQLSKAEGATGGDSILLSYPLEFLAALPFTAFRRKHWSVCSASIIMILVLWGLTPTQAGMFAVRNLHIQEEVTGTHSTSYTPIERQGNWTSNYAQSVYNIAWLNESLPPFMTKDYILDAFRPSEGPKLDSSNTTYTGHTNLYSVDLSCHQALLWNNSGIMTYNSTGGCNFGAPPYRPVGGNDTSKPFDTLYAGYQNENGFAEYYLSDTCDETFFHTFFVRWSKSTPAAIENVDDSSGFDPTQAKEASLFCSPVYYQQPVNATIVMGTHAVVDVVPVGQKSDLPSNLFNISTFEWAMNSGKGEFAARGDFPTTGFPDQKLQLSDMPLNLAYIPKMSPFAIATLQRPLDDYLDPAVLGMSYQAAYRLLFARQLSDILSRDQNLSTSSPGLRTYQTQGVVVVPAFAIAATVILGIVLVLLIGIIAITPRRENQLRHDPATLGSLMDLVAGESEITDLLSRSSNCDSDALDQSLRTTAFHLAANELQDDKPQLRLRKDLKLKSMQLRSGKKLGEKATSDPTVTTTDDIPPRGIRPMEMKQVMGVIFFIVQVAAFIAFLVLYIMAKDRKGLPLPSQSTFVRQLVQNYIPIALATLIEPCWLILNRLLCLLWPLEELRKGDAKASRSVDLDYSSLPPQLLFVRAARARHFLIMLVCFMVLLANVLAVALSGLMYEASSASATTTNLPRIKEPRFRELDGAGLPFNTGQAHNFQGGTTSDPFYREMSNLTASTPFPAWTDQKYAYVPVELDGVSPSSTIQLQTTAFGAELDCEVLQQDGAQNYSLRFSDDGTAAYLNVSLRQDDGSAVLCKDFQKWTGDSLNLLSSPQTGRVAFELGVMLTTNRSSADAVFCRQHILAGWIRADWETVSGEVSQGPGIEYYGDRKMKVTSRNDTMLLCKPRIFAGPAEIAVDSNGRLQRMISANMSSSSTSQYFGSRVSDLAAQANQFLADSGSTWHTDSHPSDFLNFLIKTSTRDPSLLDASLAAPSAEKAAAYLAALYQQLFALLIGTNLDLLLEDISQPAQAIVLVEVPETRIMVSTPAFIVAEIILACYIVTTILLYSRRPWRVLPRLPASVASNMAYFAASHALQQLSGIMDDISGAYAERLRSSWKWAYGSYVGTDGRNHTGIERQPLVTTLSKEYSRGQRDR